MLYCLLCHGRTLSRSDLCQPCAREMPWLRHGCTHCAEPLSDPAETLCLRCQADLPEIDACTVVFTYQFPLDQLVLAMKQQPRPELLTHFSRWLEHHLSPMATNKPDWLLPVPMHDSKQALRGFNQAGILARHLGRALNIPVNHELLQKHRTTEDQKTLSREQRQANLARAFRLNRKIWVQMQPRPRHVVLIDDVITTGATTAHLARILKKAGVRRVDVWALAKTPLHQPGR